MKLAAIFTAALLAATSGSAMDIDVAGQTVSIGGEVDTNYTTGTELCAVEFTPSAGVDAWGFSFEASTVVDVLKLNEGDIFTGVDLEAGYQLMDGLKAYGEISTDADLEFGDATVGVSFSF